MSEQDEQGMVTISLPRGKIMSMAMSLGDACHRSESDGFPGLAHEEAILCAFLWDAVGSLETSAAYMETAGRLERKLKDRNWSVPS